MELYVLNSNLEPISIVENYQSLIWAKRYFEFGDCELYISATAENLAVLAIGNYLMRSDDPDMICRIVKMEITTNVEDGNHIVVTGTDARNILNQRLVYGQTSFRGTAENFIRQIVTDNVISGAKYGDNRIISNFALGASQGYTDIVEIQTTFDPVGTKIIDVCRKFGYGSKITLDEGVMTFHLYRGLDRSYAQSENDYVVFSPEFDNLISTNYFNDVTNYYNMVVIAGTGEGVNRKSVTINDNETAGIERYEMYVDARDISTEMGYEDLTKLYPNGSLNGTTFTDDGQIIATVDNATEPTQAVLSDYAYNKLLEDRGVEKLAETGVTITFDGEVEPNYSYIYGVHYTLGDVVQVENEYGGTLSARVTEVIETFDDNGYVLIPTFEYEGSTSTT